MTTLLTGWKARTLAGIGAIVLLFAAQGLSTAHAATGITPDSGDQPFVFGAAGTLSPNGPFTYSASGITAITVRDGFCVGDEFRVYDNSVALGDTSVVTTDPTCSIGTGHSTGTFYVGPGSHSVDIEVTESPFGGGGAYIRVDTVTLTAENCKKGGWETYGGLFKNQGDCVAFLATQGKNEPGQNVPGSP